MENKFYRNVYIYYIFTFFRWLSFWIPIYTLFYLDIGLTYTEINIVIAARSFMAMLLEVPSGVFADFFGRKLSLVLASLFQIIGFVILLNSNSFIDVLIANLVIGGLFAFTSGADNSLLYDSLLQAKREGEFKKVLVIASALTSIALAVASFFGGFIADEFGLRMAIIFNIGAYIIALIVILFAKEPKIESPNFDRNYFKHTVESAKLIIKRRDLLWISVFFAFITVASEVTQTIRQPYLREAGLSESAIGMANSLFLVCAMLVAAGIIYSSKKMGGTSPFFISLILITIQSLILGMFIDPVIGILALCTGQVSKGIGSIFVDEYSNRQIESSRRATSLSFQNFLISILTIILIPVFGLISDKIGVQGGFTSLFIFLSIFGTTALLLFRANYQNDKAGSHI